MRKLHSCVKNKIKKSKHIGNNVLLEQSEHSKLGIVRLQNQNIDNQTNKRLKTEYLIALADYLSTKAGCIYLMPNNNKDKQILTKNIMFLCYFIHKTWSS